MGPEIFLGSAILAAVRRLVGGWALALCACGPVVDIGPGTDAETSDSDAPTTGMMTATTEPMTTAGPSTTVLDTSASASNSTTVGTTDDPQSIPGGVCVPRCETPVDCCGADPSCPGMLGEYPYDYGCANGFCTFGGCESDDECTFGGVLEGYVCVEIDGLAGCWPSCTSDEGCADQGLSGWVCDPELGVCALPSCASDAECTDGTVCRGNPGMCVYPCEQGQDICAGFGRCDPDTGQCVCDHDDDCMDGYGCTPG